jgi:redox-sensitive bicupin YhaK (pirin superfamily)
MLVLRKSADRGTSTTDWLNAKFTFSFESYKSPLHTSFGPLRVLNEDVIAPKNGFSSHPHREYQIITYMISGEVTHADDMGNVDLVTRGDVQLISAGTGIYHSEHNRHRNLYAHALQIWIKPWKSNLVPSYQTKHFSDKDKLNALYPIIVPNRECFAGSKDVLTINQDAFFCACILENGKQVEHFIVDGRKVYIHIVDDGTSEAFLTLNMLNESIQATRGDGIFVTPNAMTTLSIKCQTDGDSAQKLEFVLFDMA